MISRIINWFKKLKENDPVYSCIFYRDKGCVHVDGFQCDMKTCDVLKDYKIRELEQLD